ncbi:nitrate reductase molybdenum cofactor assembly chaperone [Streptomyces sp. INA 01156]
MKRKSPKPAGLPKTPGHPAPGPGTPPPGRPSPCCSPTPTTRSATTWPWPAGSPTPSRPGRGPPLLRFAAHAERTAPADLTAAYVATFDHRKRCCPYLTYYAHGDTRKRGMGLLRLNRPTPRPAGGSPTTNCPTTSPSSSSSLPPTPTREHACSPNTGRPRTAAAGPDRRRLALGARPGIRLRHPARPRRRRPGGRPATRRPGPARGTGRTRSVRVPVFLPDPVVGGPR